MFLIYLFLLEAVKRQTDSSNTTSGKLQKLGAGQKIFIFRGGG